MSNDAFDADRELTPTSRDSESVNSSAFESDKKDKGKMPKELYHFKFEHKKASLWEFVQLTLLLTVLGVLIGAYGYFYVHNKTIYGMNIIAFFGGVFFVIALISGAILFLGLFRYRGEDIDDEFILYDNGWFLFWSGKYNDGWVAPAKIDWLFPPGMELKPFNLKEIPIHRTIRKKKGRYNEGFGLYWGLPKAGYENWAFHASAGGWLTHDEHEKLLEMIDYLKKRSKENIDTKRISVPEKNPVQQSSGMLKQPSYWNSVFIKEGIKDLYFQETGEEIPEPVYSYLFDRTKYADYLRRRKETGEWLL